MIGVHVFKKKRETAYTLVEEIVHHRQLSVLLSLSSGLRRVVAGEKRGLGPREREGQIPSPLPSPLLRQTSLLCPPFVIENLQTYANVSEFLEFTLSAMEIGIGCSPTSHLT